MRWLLSKIYTIEFIKSIPNTAIDIEIFLNDKFKLEQKQIKKFIDHVEEYYNNYDFLDFVLNFEEDKIIAIIPRLEQ